MVDDVSTGCVSTTITEPFLAMRKIASYYTSGIMNAAVPGQINTIRMEKNNKKYFQKIR
jgi:hypothetical protein